MSRRRARSAIRRGGSRFSHILPNILPALLVQATLSIAAAIIAEAALSFLGLGQQPPAPSWGSMLNAAQRFLTQAPWMAIWPGLAIFLVVLSLNLLGDGLRDALDPRSALDHGPRASRARQSISYSRSTTGGRAKCQVRPERSAPRRTSSSTSAWWKSCTE